MEERKEIYTMIGIWKKIVCMDEKVNLTPRLKEDLHKALKKRFEGSLVSWECYCTKIANNARAQLPWAIQINNIDKILRIK